jgi:hypothetical protein
VTAKYALVKPNKSKEKAGISLVFLGRIQTFQRVAANPNENFLVGFNSLSRLWVSASRVPLLHIPWPQDRRWSGPPSTTGKILAYIVVFEKLLLPALIALAVVHSEGSNVMAGLVPAIHEARLQEDLRRSVLRK